MIYYFRGLESEYNSNKVKYLKARFGDELEEVQYHPRDPLSAMSAIKELDPDAIFVGTSMGAFWANVASFEHFGPSVVVNPVFDPEAMLNLDLGNVFGITGQPMVALLSTNDELFAKYWPAFEQRYGNICEITYDDNTTHRFENYRAIGDAINRIKRGIPHYDN